MKIYEKPDVEFIELAMQESITLDGSTGVDDSIFGNNTNGVSYNNG